MLGKRRSYPRQVVWNGVRELLAANVRVMLIVSAICTSVLLILWWTLDGYVLGLAQGLFVGIFGAIFVVAMILSSGVANQLAGAWGEDNTTDELRKAKRRGQIHDWVDSLRVKGGDVDHLVAAPSGLYAIDSKWHSHGIDAQVVDRDTESAKAAARRAQLILRSRGLRQVVQPAVVVWGGDQLKVPNGLLVRDGVAFVSGSHFKKWLSHISSERPTLSKSDGRAICQELRLFQDGLRLE
ncbi:MAG TPA: nuclease-related domain-containing protein [Nocardioides sp.]|nr:nuclease-related domain-containing protein [Nocardioides sp.]